MPQPSHYTDALNAIIIQMNQDRDISSVEELGILADVFCHFNGVYHAATSKTLEDIINFVHKVICHASAEYFKDAMTEMALLRFLKDRLGIDNPAVIELGQIKHAAEALANAKEKATDSTTIPTHPGSSTRN